MLKAVVEVLQSSAAQVAGCESTGELKEPSITALTWQRFVKDVMNARTLGGKTPLMLACENGCAAAVPPPHANVPWRVEGDDEMHIITKVLHWNAYKQREERCDCPSHSTAFEIQHNVWI